VTDEIRALLACHLPGYEVRSITRLGEGLDNAVYDINGELIVRTSKEANHARRSEATRREAELLVVVAELSTLPVPEPVFTDIEAGVLGYPRLPGLPLMDHPVAESARLAPALGRFLGCLHQTPLKKVEHLVERDTYSLSAWLEDAQRDYQKISGHLPAAYRRQVEGFLGCTPPAEPRAAVLCNNDVGAEHVLVDTGANAVTGIIDWTDAAIADPARDLALVYRDLGPEAFELVLAHYSGPFDEADRERAAFYARGALLEDIAYGLSTPDERRYVEAGLAHLARSFGDARSTGWP
jgi:aminoglycoside phosphotransferase (APT) family kinase protein